MSNRVVLLKSNGASVVEILRVLSYYSVRVCDVCSAFWIWTTSEPLRTTPSHIILIMVFGSGNKFRIKRYVDTNGREGLFSKFDITCKVTAAPSLCTVYYIFLFLNVISYCPLD